MLSIEPFSTTASTGVGARLSRLLVTRRDAQDRTYRALGFLDRVFDERNHASYRFSYLTRLRDEESFVPLIGFRDRSRVYTSPRMFPTFAERIMGAERPDRTEYLEALGLSEDAEPWEILTSSGGHRDGDPIELIPVPTIDQQSMQTTSLFLVHGIRHMSEAANSRIEQLLPGTALELRHDPQNKYNSRTIDVMDGELKLGYVPVPLLDHAHSVLNGPGYELEVVAANSAEAHPHLRLLVRLTGKPTEYVFDRPEWATPHHET